MIRVPELLSTIRSSFWFVPSVMLFGAIAMAVAMTEIDERIPRDMLVRWPRLFGAGAEGSRAMLSAIAGSMMTVASLTFSITMLALSQTATQYSPRILRNFMSDRGTQIVLGVFVGVFAYCLVVLRTISGGEEHRFLPSVSVTVAGVFALLAIGFLVFFIHRMALSLQAATIIANVGEETLHTIDRLFPDKCEDEPEGERLQCSQEKLQQVTIDAPATGYVESVDAGKLLRAAVRHSAVIKISCRVGDFVIQGNPIGCASASNQLDSKAAKAIGNIFVISRHRSVYQDPAFGIQQLVDVALKALSPGVNDPTTAIMSIEYLTAIVEKLATRRIEPEQRRDENGRLRVEVPVPSFAELAETAFGPIRAVTQDATVLRKLAASLAQAGSFETIPPRRQFLSSLLDQLARAARKIHEPDDRVAVDREIRSAQLRLSNSGQS